MEWLKPCRSEALASHNAAYSPQWAYETGTWDVAPRLLQRRPSARSATCERFTLLLREAGGRGKDGGVALVEGWAEEKDGGGAANDLSEVAGFVLVEGTA